VISQLSGTDVAMRDDEFDAIYVVVIPSPWETRVLRLRYGQPTSPPKPSDKSK
jgi:hypothetical protein